MSLTRIFIPFLCLLLLAPVSATATNLYENDVQLLPLNTQSEQALSKLKGHIVYLDFWASWCIPCRDSFPFMNQLQEKYNAQGLRIITINVDKSTDDANKFLHTYPALFPAYQEPEQTLLKHLSVKGLPTSFVFNREGALVHRFTGFNPFKAKKVEKTLSHLLSLHEPNSAQKKL